MKLHFFKKEFDAFVKASRNKPERKIWNNWRLIMEEKDRPFFEHFVGQKEFGRDWKAKYRQSILKSWPVLEKYHAEILMDYASGNLK